jgi:sister chromatid cohesion protein PDS5
MVANTRHGGQPSTSKLKFREKLITKGQATDALLKKLKTLNTELRELDQELVEVKTLDAVRKELINNSLLLHKDRGVKAHVSCCLADILRLYAPDAPYSQGELRDIFQFFFKQLTLGLKGTDSAYYSEYYQLLESLSTVKSVVLICDLPDAEGLVQELFNTFFLLIRRNLSKNVEICMSDILVAVVDELDNCTPKLVETIMSQFMERNTVCKVMFALCLL